eukprot:453822_1
MPCENIIYSFTEIVRVDCEIRFSFLDYIKELDYLYDFVSCFAPIYISSISEYDCVGTFSPTIYPTTDPTYGPTIDPTNYPTNDPTFDPTNDPTTNPTSDPTYNPIYDPTNDPTNNPTNKPTNNPTNNPTLDPTNNPTGTPSFSPTLTPSFSPVLSPTPAPSLYPSLTPTITPSQPPTIAPTQPPTFSPTQFPTYSNSFGSKFIDIIYDIEYLSEPQLQNMVNNIYKTLFDIQIIIQQSYVYSAQHKLQTELQYRHFEMIFLQLNTIKLSDYYHQYTEKNKQTDDTITLYKLQQKAMKIWE